MKRGPNICLACDYPLGEPPMSRCPECGLEVDDAIKRALRTRMALARRARHYTFDQGLNIIIVVVVMTIGCVLMRSSTYYVVIAPMVSLVGIALCWGMLIIPASFLPVHENAAMVALSLRGSWYIHVWWMATLPAAIAKLLFMWGVFTVMRALGQTHHLAAERAEWLSWIAVLAVYMPSVFYAMLKRGRMVNRVGTRAKLVPGERLSRDGRATVVVAASALGVLLIVAIMTIFFGSVLVLGADEIFRWWALGRSRPSW